MESRGLMWQECQKRQRSSASKHAVKRFFANLMNLWRRFIVANSYNTEVRTSVLWHCWLGDRKGIRSVKKLSGEVLAWLGLSVWSDVQTCWWPLLLTVSCFSKIQIGLPFWYPLTWVVPDKGPLNGCVCVCEVRTEYGLANLMQRVSQVSAYGFLRN